MKPFRFTLNAVRSLRERQEQQALDGYAKASLAHQQALSRMAIAQHDLEAAWTEARRKLAAGVPAPQIAQLQAYTRSVESRRKVCEESVAQSLCALNQAWQKFSTARQQREVMDRYHKTQKAQHDRLMQAEEFKMLDEIAARHAAVSGGIGSFLKSTP